MNITITDKTGSTSLIIPVVPSEIPIINPTKNQVFETINKDLNIIGNEGLKEISWESFFPNKEYSFAAVGSDTNGWNYVDFINKCKKNKQPIRIVYTSNDKHTILNMLASIEKWEYKTDKVGDIKYSLGLKEWGNDL